jgi:flagellar biosynthesis/type III secretory pathway protein FliH
LCKTLLHRLHIKFLELFISLASSRQEGRKAGRQEGRKAGRQEGRKAGRQEGTQAGRHGDSLAIIIFKSYGKLGK